MGKVESQTKNKKRIIIQKNKICNFGRARYLYENAVAGEQGYTLSRTFRNSIMYLLPRRYNERTYMQFIENWGTVSMHCSITECIQHFAIIQMQHITITVDVGTRQIQRSSSSYSEVYKYLKKKVCFGDSYR